MRIIFQNADGGCSIVIPAPNSGLTLAEVIDKSVPTGTAYKVVADDDIPTDRTYRNAWVADVVAGKITHDMAKAREIHKNYFREARKPLLEALDVQYAQADERGDAQAKSAIAAKRQALRDVTADPSIAAASTPDQLKSTWPAILGTNPLL